MWIDNESYEPQDDIEMCQCSRCGSEIYSGDIMYIIDYSYVCEDCASDEEKSENYCVLAEEYFSDEPEYYADD